jgi:hypothetical protein
MSTDGSKLVKILHKKLRQIEGLRDRQSGGVALNGDQLGGFKLEEPPLLAGRTCNNLIQGIHCSPHTSDLSLVVGG